ncbi:MAG: alpha/beta fold hydrolase [bacterium]
MDDARWPALRAELEALPQRPAYHTMRGAWLRAVRVADFITHVRHNVAGVLARLNPYPKPFRHVAFRAEDGVQLAGWLGPQHRTSPSPWGIVLVPGMFATKDDTVHKRQAILIHRHWRVPVLAIDLRAFGESTGIATAGWKEALDVHGAAKFLMQETGVKRVAVLSESLGGAAALNALAHDSRSGANILTGGTVCFSAFVDARDAVRHISEKPPKGHPFRQAWGGFRRLLLMKSSGAYERYDEFLEDAARVNGLASVEELYDLANPKWKVPMIQQPTLLVHAMDDPIVPVRHARRMERYAEGKPNIQTLIVPWGGHTQFEVLDAWWYWEVTRKWFGAVNGMELENLAGK